MEKDLLILKFGLLHESNAWYSNRENSHKHLIFKDAFFQTITVYYDFVALCKELESYE